MFLLALAEPGGPVTFVALAVAPNHMGGSVSVERQPEIVAKRGNLVPPGFVALQGTPMDVDERPHNLTMVAR